MLVADILRHSALRTPGKSALITVDRTFTYVELDAAVNAVASALVRRGIARGDRVAVLARSRWEYVALYYGLARVGALLVPLNCWHRPVEHEYTIDDSEPALMIVSGEFAESVAGLVTARDIDVVHLPDGEEAAPPGWTGWTEFMSEAPPLDGAEVVIERDDPHMILYTSGTTGRPKGALLSHGRTTDDALAMALALRLRPSDVFANFFPPFHVAHWDHMKLFHLVGANVVLLPQFEPEAVLTAVERHRVTVMLAVPAMLHQLFRHPTFDGRDLSSIRLLYYGAYDPSGLMLQVADYFGAPEGRIEMFHTYGLTETGPFVTICDSADLFDKFGSIGRAMPGVEVALLDDDGQVVLQGSPGEICVKGPRMTGYWRNAEATEVALAGGWLHTGDLAVADADGFLRIVDRKKDTIRSGGQNVYSKQVEDRLLLHDAVDDCAVIGVPDAVYEERVLALVVLEPDYEGDDELTARLQSFVRESMAGYNVPKRVVFLDALPKNAVGKTLKAELRQQYGSIFDHVVTGSRESVS